MSREMLRGTAEAALGFAETYQDYLFVRARNLTGENSSTPASLGDIAVRLLVAGALAPSPHLMDFTQETIANNGDTIQMLGEDIARRAWFALEVADYMSEPQKASTSGG